MVDVAAISSIEWARHADRLRLLPRLCVSSEGAGGSIQLVTRLPLDRVRRYFEKLLYTFGPRERAGLCTFLEMARDVGALGRVPELRFVRDRGRR